MHFSLRGALAAIALGAIVAVPAYAENGVTADSITFGQAAVLEGPASALGLGMQLGLNAAFNEVNAKGGVHGRKLKLISVNDGYEPDRAIAATVSCAIRSSRTSSMCARATPPKRKPGSST